MNEEEGEFSLEWEDEESSVETFDDESFPEDDNLFPEDDEIDFEEESDDDEQINEPLEDEFSDPKDDVQAAFEEEGHLSDDEGEDSEIEDEDLDFFIEENFGDDDDSQTFSNIQEDLEEGDLEDSSQNSNEEDDWFDLGGDENEDSVQEDEIDEEIGGMKLLDDDEDLDEMDDDLDEDVSDSPKKNKKSKKKSRNSGFSPLSTLKNVYVKISDLLLKAVLFILELPTKIPFFNKIYNPVYSFIEKALKKIRFIIPVILVLLIVVLTGIYPGSENTVDLPDNGEVKISRIDKNENKITATIDNSGETIVYGNLDAKVSVRTINPISWFSPKEIGVCKSDEFELNIEESEDIDISCGFNVPSGSSISVEIR